MTHMTRIVRPSQRRHAVEFVAAMAAELATSRPYERAMWTTLVVATMAVAW